MYKRLLLLCGILVILNAGGKESTPAKSPIISIEEIDPWYVGVGGVYGKYDSICSNLDAYEDVTYGGIVRVGYELNFNWSIEGRVLGTFLDEGPNGGETMRHYGLYVKPSYEMTDHLHLYGLAGYGYSETVNDGGNGNLPELDAWDFAYGVGIEYLFDDNEDERQVLQEQFPGKEIDTIHSYEDRWGIFLEYQSLWRGQEFYNKALNKHGEVDIDAITFGVVYYF